MLSALVYIRAAATSSTKIRLQHDRLGNFLFTVSIIVFFLLHVMTRWHQPSFGKAQGLNSPFSKVAERKAGFGLSVLE